MVGNIYIRGANGNNDYVGLTTFRDNVRINQPAGTDATLEVNGQVKITGGSPSSGKVLTSDADGLATWENIPNNSCNVYQQNFDASTNFPTGWTRTNSSYVFVLNTNSNYYNSPTNSLKFYGSYDAESATMDVSSCNYVHISFYIRDYSVDPTDDFSIS